MEIPEWLLGALAAAVLTLVISILVLRYQLMLDRMYNRLEKLYTSAWMWRRRLHQFNASSQNFGKALTQAEDDFRLSLAMATPHLCKSNGELKIINQYFDAANDMGTAILSDSADKSKKWKELEKSFEKVDDLFRQKLDPRIIVALPK